VKEAEEHEVDAAALVLEDPLGDLFRRADELRAEAVVVLDEILEGAVLPHAAPVTGGLARLLHRGPEPFDGLAVGLADDLPERLSRLGFGLAGDEESVESELQGAPQGRSDGVDLGDLLADAVEVLAVAEVPVADAARHGAGGGRVAALEDLGVGTCGVTQRLGLEVEVVEPVEVTVELRVLVRPDLTDIPDELLAAPVSLVVLKPGLTELGELVLEPAAHDVDRRTPVRQLVCRRDELRQHPGVPETRMDCGDYLQTFGREEQRETEAGGLVLVRGTVRGDVAHM